eukprot:CAMPEP_0114571046 /NCGR_PEP_ID=MMETSP0114-20121206/17537_1 /TAXON_ID=31324 /ORGANISM="Goniomonas sp, Strain m" /LENGTH=159 /DNA_ID=CAMNT_0001758139 /DNA_START=143 /DNA_END=622 /DNA_ORIENTATION=+
MVPRTSSRLLSATPQPSDLPVNCEGCNVKFIVSYDDQMYYHEHGWQMPKRCPECRQKKRDSMEKAAQLPGQGGGESHQTGLNSDRNEDRVQRRGQSALFGSGPGDEDRPQRQAPEEDGEFTGYDGEGCGKRGLGLRYPWKPRKRNKGSVSNSPSSRLAK